MQSYFSMHCVSGLGWRAVSEVTRYILEYIFSKSLAA